jgi:hypothetical protein
MRIAYLTTDEVNEDLAAKMSTRCGAALHAFSPADVPRNGAYDAVICDWDFLPRGQRKKIVCELIRNHGDRAVIVHSYNLSARQVRALRRRRVAVYRRLKPSIFVGLTRPRRMIQVTQFRSLSRSPICSCAAAG